MNAWLEKKFDEGERGYGPSLSARVVFYTCVLLMMFALPVTMPYVFVRWLVREWNRAEAPLED
jgi:hypothetical protein